MIPQPRVPEGRSFDTASWITLRWTRGTRYYRVHLEQDLWQVDAAERRRQIPIALVVGSWPVIVAMQRSVFTPSSLVDEVDRVGAIDIASGVGSVLHVRRRSVSSVHRRIGPRRGPRCWVHPVHWIELTNGGTRAAGRVRECLFSIHLALPDLARRKRGACRRFLGERR